MTAELTVGDLQGAELPYPMAQRLRAEGMNDRAILNALLRAGVPADDAKFVMSSLPGGSLDVSGRSTGAPAELSSGGDVTGEGFPMAGIAMLGVGVLITVGSYASAAPGGTYVVTWGLILAGLMRMLRGR